MRAGADLVSPRVDCSADGGYEHLGGLPPEKLFEEFSGFSNKDRLILEFFQMDDRILSEQWEKITDCPVAYFPTRLARGNLEVSQLKEVFAEPVLYGLELDERDNVLSTLYQIGPTVSEWGVCTYEIDVLSDFVDGWELMRDQKYPGRFPTYRDLQLIVRDFDVSLSMDWSSDGILDEAPELLNGLKGITIVVDHEDTANWRVTNAFEFDAAIDLTHRVRDAFQQRENNSLSPVRNITAHEIRERSDFRHVLILSEYPDETQEKVNSSYRNFRMDGFKDPFDGQADSPDNLLSPGIDVGEYTDEDVPFRAWPLWHDAEYIGQITRLVEKSGGTVHQWPAENLQFDDALEALGII